MSIDVLPPAVVQAVVSQSQEDTQHQHSEGSGKAGGVAPRPVSGVTLSYESGHECLDGAGGGGAAVQARWRTEIHIVCNLTAGAGRPRALALPVLRYVHCIL